MRHVTYFAELNSTLSVLQFKPYNVSLVHWWSGLRQRCHAAWWYGLLPKQWVIPGHN